MSSRVRALLLLGVIVLATLALWDTWVTYPVQLLVVFVHECGHAFAAILTGGKVSELVVNPNLSGHMMAAGGNGIIVASAGYLTSVLFGAALIMLSSRRRMAKVAIAGLGGGLMLLSVVFALKMSVLALVFGTLLGALLVFIAYKAPPLVVRGSLFYLAAASSIYSLYDIRSDVLHLSSPGTTDATILQSITHVPAIVWALLWAVIAGVIMFFAVRFAIRRWS